MVDWGGSDGKMAETLEAYRRSAVQYANRTRRFSEGSRTAEALEAFARKTPSGIMLDAGAGGGRDARYLAGLGRSVIALDAVRAFLVNATTRVTFVAGDVRQLPFAAQAFAGIWCSAVLLHLSPGGMACSLSEFRRVLQSGGLLHVSVKEGHGTYSSRLSDGNRMARHFYLYTKTDIRRCLLTAGFTIERVWNDVERDSGGVDTTWMKVWARPA